MIDSLFPKSSGSEEKATARSMLCRAALFLGELRDGLTMINMQSAYLIVSKNYTEKQAGILFFVFGMSQFLFQTPAGYMYDYSEHKVFGLGVAAISTTLLTLATAAFAAPYGANLPLMIAIKFLQGAVTSFIPPGLNSITQGIVGSTGMTEQVSVNEMMNHLGTAVIVLIGSILGYALYPNLGLLFLVSPVACAGVLYFLSQIPSDDIDHAAARGLIVDEDKPTTTADYIAPTTSTTEPNHESGPTKGGDVRTQPSFNFGWANSVTGTIFADGGPKAESPFKVLRDPALLTFIVIVFLFHTANGTVLPLVMQTLAIASGRSGMLMSGLCIIVAQVFMVISARVCGEYSGQYGRKGLFLVGLFVVPIRCLILTLLLQIRGEDNAGSNFLQMVILSTQILDGVGAGVFGTMYILVTSDLSRGSGRFSLTLGLTTAAMSIGGTVSGYLGEALAQDLGYEKAFFILMVMSLAPALLYLFCMPETLVALTHSPIMDNNMKDGEHTTMNQKNEISPQAAYKELV